MTAKHGPHYEAKKTEHYLMKSGKIEDLQYLTTQTGEFILRPGVKLQPTLISLYNRKSPYNCGRRAKISLVLSGIKAAKEFLNDLDVCFCNHCRTELVSYTLHGLKGPDYLARDNPYNKAKIKHMEWYTEQVQQWAQEHKK